MKISFQNPTLEEWGQSEGNDTMHTSGIKNQMCRMAVLLSGLVILFGSAATSAQEPENNKINGKVPKAPTKCLVETGVEPFSYKLHRRIFKIEPGLRAPGTRSPVHVHPNSGATCVINGEMTLILQGKENKTFKGDISQGLVSCYPMPAPTNSDINKMSAVNTGTDPAHIIDIFPVPKGVDWKTFNAMCVIQNEGLDAACYKTGAGCPIK